MSIRVSSLALVLGLFCSSYSSADTTGNLVTDNSCQAWQVTPGTLCVNQNWWGGTSGGHVLQINNNDGKMFFGYTEQIAARAWAINQALAQSGLQVDGFNYRWELKNANVESGQGRAQDPLVVTVNIVDINNTVVESYTYDYSRPLTGQWYQFAGTETFNTPYSSTYLNELQFSVRGRDAGFWAGYYGPEFRLQELSLNYSPVTPNAIGAEVDQCSQVPVTDPTCPGFIGNQSIIEDVAIIEQPIIQEPVIVEPIAEAITVVETITTPAEPIQAPTEQPAPQQVQVVEQTQTNEVQTTNTISTSRILSIVQNSTEGQDGNISTQVLTQGTQLPQNVVSSATMGSSQTQQTSANEQQGANDNTSQSSGDQNGDRSLMAGLNSNEGEQRNENSEQTEDTLGYANVNLGNVSLNAYNAVLPDVAFYISEEIYKRQYVPDSKRGLRMGLANEIKWNQMVDLQYTK